MIWKPEFRKITGCFNRKMADFELHRIYASILQLDVTVDGVVITAMLRGGQVVTYYFRTNRAVWWIYNRENVHTSIHVVGLDEPEEGRELARED